MEREVSWFRFCVVVDSEFVLPSDINDVLELNLETLVEFDSDINSVAFKEVKNLDVFDLDFIVTGGWHIFSVVLHNAEYDLLHGE